MSRVATYGADFEPVSVAFSSCWQARGRALPSPGHTACPAIARVGSEGVKQQHSGRVRSAGPRGRLLDRAWRTHHGIGPHRPRASSLASSPGRSLELRLRLRWRPAKQSARVQLAPRGLLRLCVGLLRLCVQRPARPAPRRAYHQMAAATQSARLARQACSQQRCQRSRRGRCLRAPALARDQQPWRRGQAQDEVRAGQCSDAVRGGRGGRVTATKSDVARSRLWCTARARALRMHPPRAVSLGDAPCTRLPGAHPGPSLLPSHAMERGSTELRECVHHATRNPHPARRRPRRARWQAIALEMCNRWGRHNCGRESACS